MKKREKKSATYSVRVKIVDRLGIENDYAIRPIGGDVRVTHGQWEFRKLGVKTPTTYFVRRHPVDDELECTCLGGERWKYCKHIEFLEMFTRGVPFDQLQRMVAEEQVVAAQENRE